MKNNQYRTISLMACVAVLLVGAQVSVANLAAASGLLADVAVMASQSSSALAAAANSGDVDAIVEAQARVDAVDAAMTEAQEAYSAMEQASNAGDEDAAASAADDLAAAKQKASDALSGIIPETNSQSDAQGSQDQADTGGPVREGEAPNVFDQPWETDGVRNAKQALFGTFWNASSQGGASFGERDATPQ